MKKILLSLFLCTASSLNFSASVEIINPSFVQTIHSTFSPNMKINYKKFTFDQSLDLVNKTGYINAIIYPESADVSPAMFSSIFKGKDLLDVANHKTITFKSNKINFTSDNTIASVSGILTVKNKSTPIIFRSKSCVCKGDLGQRTCVSDFTADLDRTKLNLNYGTSFGLSKQAPIHFKLTVKEKN